MVSVIVENAYVPSEPQDSGIQEDISNYENVNPDPFPLIEFQNK